ncbi:sulfurtransferase TusA family protein [Pseudolabrys sp. FHR47]|uniref:sulfurtransferase TusA family protein n=1 Tax=Pseudolabrys sp. FHR47 TaxID=2562284 RepID=UPI0010BE6DB2|nr:sulfurtransferase TusA family protein [Pseudolabrys sp. FHR47]
MMTTAHPHPPDVSFDGGDLDCGNGLLLLIRKHIDPMARGQLLEILSTEISVDEDLPAWCRLTGNDLVSFVKDGKQRSFLICKGRLDGRGQNVEKAEARPAIALAARPAPAPAAPPRERRDASPIPSLSVMGIGSWPRPRWMVETMHDYVSGKLDEAAFHETANDAVRLVAAAQDRAGVGVMTDGEQRRDSYASFVATRLDNTQLIPLTDLLPLVDHPEEFERELRALDVPAADVRHPAVFGRIGRSRSLAAHEFDFLRTLTGKPIKIALPGPYLLTRTMWMECLQERAYQSREEIAEDIVAALRAELAELIDAGVSLIQFDEPVLSEVVFSGPKSRPSFMCGALSESRGPEHELAFARDLVNAVVNGMPRERIAVHVCRGNWTPDESVALAGSYAPLIDTLGAMKVGAYLLEMCTPRAGEMELLRQLPDDARIGVGVVNQKCAHTEAIGDIEGKIKEAVDLFGRERVLLHPDCGFATFADNPICGMASAEEKLAAIVSAAERVR